ncbi:MAG: glycerol-3-phosphate dehydrogenase/oxidase [Gammaproteobacteria bacterium]|nr:glycerol-3-phosphate dehydrogenase/oxidase [Gammaproteobacteria bacterium]
MQRDPAALSGTTFDVLVIGGGISGAWLALLCARSGYKTALIEQGDFAGQTSSASSKLLHGGIRYLQQLQFAKVRESVLERARYIHAAPHLSHSVPFIVPTYRDPARSKLFLNCGMLVYRLLCWGENRIIGDPEQQVPGSMSVNAAKLNAICDLSEEPHTGGVIFHERHLKNSERMVLSVLQTAHQHGASIQNYVTAVGLSSDNGAVSGARVRDILLNQEFDVRSKLTINAAGPWIDKLNGVIDGPRLSQRITGFALGAHIITRQISDHAIAITTRQQADTRLDRGGRHVFIIPWRGFSLIGTSYEEVGSAEFDPELQVAHVKQLLHAVREGIPSANLQADDLVGGFAGYYPLQTSNIKSHVYQGSGEYQIVDHEAADRRPGLITALGAKFTTARKLAALTMPLVHSKLKGRLDLDEVKLYDAAYQSEVRLRESAQQRFGEQLPGDIIDHLVSQYGSNIDEFMVRLGDDETMHARIMEGQPDIFGQLLWAAEREQALHLDDALWRRTSLGLLGINSHQLEQAAAVMAAACGWDAETLQSETEICRKRLDQVREVLTVACDD